MSYDEETEDVFRLSDSGDDEPLDMVDDMHDFGLDEEDPDRDG